MFNFIAFIVALALSFTIDKKSTTAKENAKIVNFLLFSCLLYFLMAVTIALNLWGPPQLALFIGKITFMFMAWECVNASAYIITFPQDPKKKAKTMAKLFKYILYGGAFYLVFVAKGAFTQMSIRNDVFSITSRPIFRGPLGRQIPVSWLNLLYIIYLFVIPFFAMIMALVKTENTKDRLLKQKRLITAISVIATWLSFLYVQTVKATQPMVLSLIMLCILPQIFLIYVGNVVEEIWNFGAVIRSFLRFGLRYLIPALIVGASFAILWPSMGENLVLFCAIFIPIVSVMMIFWYYTERLIRNKDFLRDNNYASKFEAEITAIDFNEDPTAVIERVFATFKKTMTTSSMKILVSSGNENYRSVYNSEGDPVEVRIDPAMFDILLSARRQVIFREWAAKTSSVIAVRPQIMKLLNETNSEAFIVLNEGRQVISIIMLGKKSNMNLYSEYDMQILNKFYSNLFVIGYYVKNIMNEAIIGTVNREIRMSDQIITSIQENMDKIKHDKADVGYLMVPAHNIGGEFVDMIRLNDQRYIFIIGALSGKGIAASMSMVILKSIIRTFLAETGDFKLLVQKVNQFIRNSLPKGTFFAGTFGLIDFASDTLFYINCGVAALFMYTRAYNNVIEIQGSGRILGFVNDIAPLVKVKKVKLSPGDMILACTDGLIESKSLRGEMFGKSRIQHTMMDNSNYPAERMAKFTYDALVKFTSKELDDDVTIFMMKYLGAK